MEKVVFIDPETKENIEFFVVEEKIGRAHV